MEKRLERIENDVINLKNDVTNLKNDVADLKNDVTNLKNDVADLKNDVTVFKDDAIRRFENIENALQILIQEVRIGNNTLQGVFNVGFESYKNVAMQRDVSEILRKAYEEAFQKLSRKIV